MIALLAWRVDLGEVRERLLLVAPLPLLAAAVVFYTGVLLHALRWRALLRFRGADLDLRTLLGIILGANFLNLILPGNLGGDIYRIQGVRHETRGLLQSTGLVLLERYCGLCATLLMALAVITTGDLARREPGLAFALGVLIALFAAPFLALVPGVAPVLERALLRWRLPRVAQTLSASVAAAREFLARPGVALRVLLLSASMKVCVATVLVLLARALSLHLRWIDVVVFLPLHNVVSALPFTLNGLGFREANLVVFVTRLGVSTEEGASLALLHLLWVYATACPGVFLLRRRPRHGGPQIDEREPTAAIERAERTVA